MKIVFVIITIASLWFGIPWVILKLYKEIPTSGQIGDVFGSVNALFSGVALAAVAYTLYLQKREIEEQRRQGKITAKLTAIPLLIHNDTIELSQSLLSSLALNPINFPAELQHQTDESKPEKIKNLTSKEFDVKILTLEQNLKMHSASNAFQEMVQSNWKDQLRLYKNLKKYKQDLTEVYNEIEGDENLTAFISAAKGNESCVGSKIRWFGAMGLFLDFIGTAVVAFYFKAALPHTQSSWNGHYMAIYPNKEEMIPLYIGMGMILLGFLLLFIKEIYSSHTEKR